MRFFSFFSQLGKKFPRFILWIGFVLISGLLASPVYAQSSCPATPFRCDVEYAINLGLQYSRTQEANGILNDKKYNFLGFLSFLEKRQGLGWNSPTVGFDGMSAEDQALVQRLVREHINGYQTHQNPSVVPYNYVVGGGMMGLATYLATGGPNEVGASSTPMQALANAIVGVQNAQGSSLPNNDGGWYYYSPGGTGDLSVTQFAVAGLSAAENVIEGSTTVFPRLIPYLISSQANNGGLKYRPNSGGPRHSMTATGLWCYRLI